MSHLFSPLQIRSIVLPNRIAVSPMCMYSASNGFPSDWHTVHLGALAAGGAGVVICEATAINPAGRISPKDLGIWSDDYIAPLAKLTSCINSRGAIAAIQLAHAGRKAGTYAPGDGEGSLLPEDGSWQVVAPSAIPFSANYPQPMALDKADIQGVIDDFVAAAKRGYKAGFQIAEVHGAHGYLLHQFLSPLSNQRNDEYGGSFENRTRLIRQVVSAVRVVWPEELPLFVRVSATDWIDGGWTIDETVQLAKLLRKDGADLIDTSSGGMLPTAQIPLGAGYQTAFAERIKREAIIATGAVGLITSAEQADHIIRSGQADMVLLGRELLRDPFWPVHAAAIVGETVSWPAQYLRAAPQGSQARKPIGLN